MRLEALLRGGWPVSPDALACAGIDHAGRSGTDDQLEALGEFLAAPPSELAASPVSLRIAVAAANEGRAFVHHELRLPAPLGPELHPELDVGGALDDGIAWRHGRLLVPKYFSAFLEAPFPTFDPNHRGKWRPHELLHRLCRFAWAPDLTRFSAYLSARVSELLPVVHWYGLDEIGRARCPAHYGVMPDASVCIACERATLPIDGNDAHRAHAAAFSASALEHLQTELAACQRELLTGQTVPTPRPGLDASSDAVGYMRAHWNRITAWSFGAWIERFAVAGEDYFSSCAEHLAHVGSLTETLLGQPHVFDRQAALAARHRRWLHDLGYRALLCIEATGSETVEDQVLPVVDELAELAASGAGTDLGAVQETVTRLEAALRRSSDDAANVVFAGGWPGTAEAPHTTEHVACGLRGALPRSLADTGDDVLLPITARFIAHATFWATADLGTRLAQFVASPNTAASAFADAVMLEAWLLAPPLVDLEAERFCALTDDHTDLTVGRLRANATLRTGTFARRAAELVLDWPTTVGAPPQIALVAAQFAGTPRAMEHDDEVREVLNLVAQDQPLQGSPVIQNLISACILVWLPPAR